MESSRAIHPGVRAQKDRALFIKHSKLELPIGVLYVNGRQLEYLCVKRPLIHYVIMIIILIQSDFSFRQTILPADILMYCTDIKVCSTLRRKQ